jgi:CDP-diacylglycerol---glycerol-3-phosphate 3-phosphatidyltransferase
MTNQDIAAVVTFAAAAGSVMVSYVKARAEAQSFSAREGLLTRAERYFVLGPSLLFNIPVIGVWIIAILANFTALQRIWVVRAQAHDRMRTQLHKGE